MRRIIAAVRSWWHRRQLRGRWPPERQLQHLRLLVMADHRWMAHDRVADALTERYLAALAPDWFRHPHVDSADFRRQLGLDPQTQRTVGLPIFECVYYFDGAVDEFVLAGVYTRPDDAAAHRAQLAAVAGVQSAVVMRDSLSGLRAKLLEAAIVEARRVKDLAPADSTDAVS